MFDREALGIFPTSHWIEQPHIRFKGFHRGQQRLACLLAKKHSRWTLARQPYYGFECTSFSKRDYWSSTCLCLHNGNAKVLLPANTKARALCR